MTKQDETDVAKLIAMVGLAGVARLGRFIDRTALEDEMQEIADRLNASIGFDLIDICGFYRKAP